MKGWYYHCRLILKTRYYLLPVPKNLLNYPSVLANLGQQSLGKTPVRLLRWYKIGQASMWSATLFHGRPLVDSKYQPQTVLW